jgi:hypothetical protein
MARLFGALWVAANIVNVWRILSGVTTIENPYQRAGYIGFGMAAAAVIFYCTFHIVALTTRLVRCLKILLVVSALVVLVRGLIPLEIVVWVVVELVPTKLLLKAFTPEKG